MHQQLFSVNEFSAAFIHHPNIFAGLIGWSLQLLAAWLWSHLWKKPPHCDFFSCPSSSIPTSLYLTYLSDPPTHLPYLPTHVTHPDILHELADNLSQYRHQHFDQMSQFPNFKMLTKFGHIDQIWPYWPNLAILTKFGKFYNFDITSYLKSNFTIWTKFQ